MTAVVDRRASARSSWAELLPIRPALLPLRPALPPRNLDKAMAARVQHALATSYDLTLGAVSASSHSNCIDGAGGDFVDLIESDGQLIAILGDVSGKGAAASLVAAVVLSSLQHHIAELGGRPGLLLTKVHHSLSGMLDRTGKLVTLAIAVIDPTTSVARVASAGHHPVMLASPTGVSRLGPTCPPLGADVPCGQELEVEFSHGSALLLASDGITEQTDVGGNEFGIERLARLAEGARRLSPDAAIARVLKSVNAFAGEAERLDDQAVVVVQTGLRS